MAPGTQAVIALAVRFPTATGAGPLGPQLANNGEAHRLEFKYLADIVALDA